MFGPCGRVGKGRIFADKKIYFGRGVIGAIESRRLRPEQQKKAEDLGAKFQRRAASLKKLRSQIGDGLDLLNNDQKMINEGIEYFEFAIDHAKQGAEHLKSEGFDAELIEDENRVKTL